MKKVVRTWAMDDKEEYEDSYYMDHAGRRVIDIETMLGHSLTATKDIESMLVGVMTHLHESGADTFEILRDDNLNAWWTKKLQEIEKKKRQEEAVEKAKTSLTKEQRKLLGLNF